jgi:hypothetical protein
MPALAHRLFKVPRGFTQRLPETENRMAAKNADDAKGMEVAEQGAAIGAGREEEEKFHRQRKNKI